jgi:outer membrane scaffolding protein for murein synthesis (MipA/OmpV family)
MIRFVHGLIALLLSSPLLAQRLPPEEKLLGAAVWSRPAYQGADSQRIDLIPVIRYYGDYLFARTTQGLLEGGARLSLAPGLHLGAQLAYEQGRRTSESDFLEARNVPTLDAGASLGAHVEWDRDFGRVPVNALVRVRQHLDTDQGLKADLRSTVGLVKTERLRGGVFGQLTWSSEKSMRSYFGITPQESALTGLPAYQPGAGLRFVSVGVLGAYDLARHWVIVGSAEAHFLQEGAKDSPLTQDDTNLYGYIGLAYRF